MRCVDASFFDIFLLACCWGPSYLFIKLAVEEMAPITLVMWRIGLSAVLLLLFLVARGIRLPKWGPIWGHLVVMSVIASALPFTLFGFGEQWVDSGLAAMINGTVPYFAAVLGHFWLPDERLNWQKSGGILLGFGGFLLLLLPTILDGHIGGDTWGILAISLACFCYGLSMVYARRYIKGLAPMVAPALQLAIGSLYLVPLSLALEGPVVIQALSWQAIGSVLFLAIPGSAIAFWLYYRIVERHGALVLSTVTFLMPVIGTALGVVVMGEALLWSQLFAFVGILGGMVLIQRAISVAVSRATN